jgi:hypothetical protein
MRCCISRCILLPSWPALSCPDGIMPTLLLLMPSSSLMSVGCTEGSVPSVRTSAAYSCGPTATQSDWHVTNAPMVSCSPLARLCRALASPFLDLLHIKYGCQHNSFAHFDAKIFVRQIFNTQELSQDSCKVWTTCPKNWCLKKKHSSCIKYFFLITFLEVFPFNYI